MRNRSHFPTFAKGDPVPEICIPDEGYALFFPRGNKFLNLFIKPLQQGVEIGDRSCRILKHIKQSFGENTMLFIFQFKRLLSRAAGVDDKRRGSRYSFYTLQHRWIPGVGTHKGFAASGNDIRAAAVKNKQTVEIFFV